METETYESRQIANITTYSYIKNNSNNYSRRSICCYCCVDRYTTCSLSDAYVTFPSLVYSPYRERPLCKRESGKVSRLNTLHRRKILSETTCLLTFSLLEDFALIDYHNPSKNERVYFVEDTTTNFLGGIGNNY